MALSAEDRAQAAQHWSQSAVAPRARWWQHEQIRKHINKTICGEPLPGPADGDARFLADRLTSLPRAISIGCGEGVKEMTLMRAGVVDQFDLFEITPARVERGRALAEAAGLADRITWHLDVVDFAHPDGEWDLVYWNSALHHMMDVDEALAWTRSVGRHVYLNDFVGPTRMQWPADVLDIASRVRATLPERLLQRPDGTRYPTVVRAPNPEGLRRADPTECADSGRIIDALKRHFPGIEIRPTGGTIYHLALNDILTNFQDDDHDLLALLLVADDLCSLAGHRHYAVAVA